MAGRVAPAACLKQEPGAPLSLVDEVLEEACGRYIPMLTAQLMGLKHARREGLVVVPQLGQHVERVDVIGVVVENPLKPRDMADRPKGGAADLAHALGDLVRGGEDLLRLFVEHQVVVAKVRTTQSLF